MWLPVINFLHAVETSSVVVAFVTFEHINTFMDGGNIAEVANTWLNIQQDYAKNVWVRFLVGPGSFRNRNFFEVLLSKRKSYAKILK